MNLQKYIVNSELSKRLAELGIKQDSIFYWKNQSYFSSKIEELIYRYDMPYTWPRPDFYYSAFTVGELLEIIPVIIGQYVEFKIVSTDSYDKCYVSYLPVEPELFTDINPANSLARLATHLIENKLWVPE